MNQSHKIAKLCLEHFDTVVKPAKFKPNEWTVLSSIVLEKCQQFEVVAMGTGSKCIGKNKMSHRGDILNDSHAEVICRRALLRYFYVQILKCDSSESEVFIFDNELKKFRLKQCVKFHFFTSHVPCGDAAIFPKQNTEEFGTILQISDKITIRARDVDANRGEKRSSEDDCGHRPNKKVCLDDIYRTGAKCLQDGELQDPLLNGPAYHVTGAVRTKPGRGDPTLSVSCSDKIARWCCLGIQGALISLLLVEPIYLSSFTIAGNTPFSKEALTRALYEKSGHLQLEYPYNIGRMDINQVEAEFKYAISDDKVPSPISIIWFNSDEDNKLEVSVEGKKQGVIKKKINSESARVKICKIELFKKFIAIVDKFNLNASICKENVTTLRYQNVKRLATEYQNVWAEVKRAFKIWTNKDESNNMFFHNE